ncbi:MAG: signal recognition particle-docking protein FtsY [Moritella sp.]|uniref:signal recognition particle-docking protein FtsY n=1 Tax=Moritella sp. TaxID=78556 RepID=UPI000C0CDB6A|nr:signal recognition particle-docking protein FtsY [Moritella sp.]MBL1416740.1 signal recognition particle-docking protein FtsY [Moritella sp.]PHR88096.1 MAG: signal recognition particle-docking protein FtsY [Moritella sp.]
MAKKSIKNWFGFGKKEANNTDEDKVNTEVLVASDDESGEEKARRRAADLQLIADFEKSSATTADDHTVTEANIVVTDANVVATETNIIVAEPEVAAVEPETVESENSELAVTEQNPVTQAEVIKDAPADIQTAGSEVDEPVNKDKFFTRLKRGLSRTKGNIGSGFKSFFRGKHIDDDLFEELEEQLLIADLGVATTKRIIDNLTQQASRKQLKDAEALYDILKKDMADMLHKVEQPLVIDSNNKPHVILMVGVNGVGKTTTIGKMAKKFQAEGKSVMLAAGDTFRAAAVEQLQVWGDRNGIPVVAQHTGADSASVLFDAMQSATAKDVDVLIADTAGRLQNKAHLMDELKKVVRVMRKHDATAPHEIMLTIDAGTGQNALSQAQLFKEAVGLTGITITKLDGTAKGGVIFAVADKFEIPIRFIGIGEGIDDLRTFNSEEFIEALFSSEDKK